MTAAKQKIETNALTPDKLEDKAVAAPVEKPAEATDDTPAPAKAEDDGLVTFIVAHPFKKSHLLPVAEGESDDELEVGSEHRADPRVAAYLAHQGAGRIAD